MPEAVAIKPLHPQRQDELLRQQLDVTRQSWVPLWKDVQENLSPMLARFFITDQNKGDRRNLKMVNSIPALADRAMANGFLAHLTPPSRPWVSMAIDDVDGEINEQEGPKKWFYYHSHLLLSLLGQTNFYPKIHRHFWDCGDYAIAATLMEKDYENVVIFTALPVGTFWVAKNEKGEYDTLFREFKMSVHKMILKFGKYKDGEPKPDGTTEKEINWDYFSAEVKQAYDQNNIFMEFDICHVIKPNPNYKPGSKIGKFMRFKSCYYEKNRTYPTKTDGQYLRESGYNLFPVAITAWFANDDDDYGTDCPAFMALGDIRELYMAQKRQNQGIEKTIKPPLVGPAAIMKTANGINALPGGFTPDDMEPGKGLRPLHEVRLDMGPINDKIDKIEYIINRAFFLDLFQMLASMEDRKDITATEIIERKDEKLLGLGAPAMFFLKTLKNILEFFWEAMEEQGYVLPPPEEIQGAKFKWEFQNIFEMAQKAASLAGMDKMLVYYERLAALDPRVRYKVNGQQVMDEVAKVTGLPPNVINTDEEAQAQEQAELKAQKVEMLSTALKTSAGAAKDLSQADLGGENALTKLIELSEAGKMAGV